MKRLKNSLLLLPGLLIFLSCSKNPFPSENEIVNAVAGDLILKPGTYLHYKADYGILVAQENRENPESRLIRLPVIRIHSTSDNPGEPIFSLTGGPGVKNVWTDDVFKQAGYKDIDNPWLLKQNDLVVGYRGMDGSVTLNCPDFQQALIAENNPLSSQSLKIFGEAIHRDFQRLINDGVDIDGYNLAEVVDDLDAARTKLGYEKINLISGSYGTLVAYTYCIRYPESIYRNVMLGAGGPGPTTIWKPETVDAQLQYYAELWGKDTECIKRTPDLIKTIKSVVDRLSNPGYNGKIDIDKVRILAFFFLYDTGSAVQIFDAFVSAEKGDYSKLAFLSSAYDKAFPYLLSWGDLFSKILSVWGVDPNRDYESEMDPPGSILGSPMSKLFLAPSKYGGWPIKLIPQKYREPQFTDVPTLLVNGSIDFSSPVEYVKNDLLPYLRNGKLIVPSEMGHNDVATLQPEAFQHLVQTFLQTGLVDDSKYKFEPVNFTPSLPLRTWLRSLSPG